MYNIKELIEKRKSIYTKDRCKHICQITSRRFTSIGINTTIPSYDGCGYGRHAEAEALKKLRIQKKSDIYIIVIRVGKNGDLLNSKPCSKCVKLFNQASKFYNIKEIWYSNENGDMIKTTLHKLITCPEFISSGFRKYKNK